MKILFNSEKYHTERRQLILKLKVEVKLDLIDIPVKAIRPYAFLIGLTRSTCLTIKQKILV